MKPVSTKNITSGVRMQTEPALGSKNGRQPVLSLSVDKSSLKQKTWGGVVRRVEQRHGSPDVFGGTDRSRLWLTESKDRGCTWRLTGPLAIAGVETEIKKITPRGYSFIGLEDPDVCADADGTVHLYFSIAFQHRGNKTYRVYLGHASGSSIKRLTARPVVLSPDSTSTRFKELMAAGKNGRGRQVYLTEAHEKRNGIDYSLIAGFEEEYSGGPWKPLGTTLHPKNLEYAWCAGEVSPCVLLPAQFLKYKKLRVGILNGREKYTTRQNKRTYGTFRPGLFLYDPDTATIPWVCPTPLFQDPEARHITFASDFVQTAPKKGLLYAHVDDSFVRAYWLDAGELKKTLLRHIRKSCAKKP